MKLRLLGILGLLFPLAMSAQKVVVKDAESGKILPLVSLYDEGLNIFVSTDSLGTAELSSFTDAQTIVFHTMGYNDKVMSYSQLEAQKFLVLLEPKSFPIGEVRISASRWGNAGGDMPKKVASIPSENITLYHAQTAADLLGTTGEVFIQKSQQGGGSPMIRGFSANRLLYVVDGVRMNSAIFRSGNLHNVISLDPYAMSSTEVLFGPNSALYGSDAIGGVMNFTTHHPTYRNENQKAVRVNLLSRYATANEEKTIHADVEYRTGKFASTTSYSYTSYGDLKMGKYGPDDYLRNTYVVRENGEDVEVENDDPRVQIPSGYDQYNLMQKFRYRLSDEWDLNYGFHFSESSNLERYDRHLRTKNGEPRYGEWYYGPQRWMMHNLNLHQSHHGKLYDEVDLIAAYQLFEESRINRNFNDNERSKNYEKVDAYSFNADFKKEFSPRHKLNYGAEAVLNVVDSRGVLQDIETNTSETGPSRYPQATWSSLAIYAKDRYQFNEKLWLEASARLNSYLMKADFDTTFYPFPFTKAKVNHSALTGGLGLVYKPGQHWVFNLTASTGFRAPNVDDLGKVFDSEPGSVVVPNPDLESEYAYNLELGISKAISDFARFEVHGFYTYLDNAMVRRDYTLNGQDSIVYEGEMSKVQAVQNAAYAYVYGIQAGVEVQLARNLKFLGQYNWQKGEEELDDRTMAPSRHAAPMFGTARLSYLLKGWNVQCFANYSGEVAYEDLPSSEQSKDYMYAKDADGNPYSPSWYTINLSASGTLYKNIGLTVGVENLTNQRYRPYSSGIAAAGLGASVALQYRY